VCLLQTRSTDGQAPQKVELRNRLFEILKELAFKSGNVTLASGKQSDFYFDMKPAMLDPEGVNLLADLVLLELQGVKADCIGGLEMAPHCPRRDEEPL
jgi:orotate phosphoribosyltransferase